MEKNYTEGSLAKGMLTFSIPYLISCFLQTFYGLADLYVTGQFNGSASISAVSIGSQVMHMVTVIIVGFAVGSTVTIGQHIGSKDLKKAGLYVGNTIVLFLSISVIMTVGMLLCKNGLIVLLDTPPEAVAQTRAYLSICFAGIPFITAYNIISCIYRGIGDSRTPLIFIFIACILNVGLDYIFIGFFGLGASGAALGTVLAQACSVLFALIFLRIKGFPLPLSVKDLKPDFSVIRQILQIGIPIACQDGFIQIAFLFITMIANGRGLAVSASVGIVEKIISFLFLVPSAMMSSVSAIASQNVGAGRHDRAKSTLYYGLTVVIVFGAIVTVITQITSHSIIGLFTTDPEVITLGAQYLRGYISDCIVAGIHFCFSGFFCAYGKSTFSFIANLAAIVCVRVPGVWLMSKLFPATLFPMGLVVPAGSALTALIFFLIYVRTDWTKATLSA